MKKLLIIATSLVIALSVIPKSFAEETTTGNGLHQGQGHGKGQGQGMKNGKGTGKRQDEQSMRSCNLEEKVNAFPVYELTEQQKQGLAFMWEEEKLARDIYIAFSELYPQRVFKNIQKSEQRHMDAVKALLNKYSIAVPASETVGEFTNSELKALYSTLLERGKTSQSEAIKIGIEIEELDIKDLNTQLPKATLDIKAIYENLLKGSQKHLSAFKRQSVK